MMKTNFKTSEKSAEAILAIAKQMSPVNSIVPKKFIKTMIENEGTVSFFSIYGASEDGLERRNPIIVALGDSVTAGHFEHLVPFEKLISDYKFTGECIEVTDSRESYIEKFRYMLIDKFETTSVSMINAGIAGDNIIGMHKRLYRDVINHNPDLVLVNASLNWGEDCGDNLKYQTELSEVIAEIKAHTEADIILLTPNMEVPGPLVNKTSSLAERVSIIRSMAREKKVCLADTYAVWEEYVRQGYPLKDLLANGLNHPSITGHEVYAITLMKLLE